MRAAGTLKFRCAMLGLALLATAVPPATAEEDAPTLAARAEALLDRWDGDAAQLESAKADIDAALRLVPDSPHYRGLQARRILLAGTSEDGIRQSALLEAHGILLRTVEAQPGDARAFAFLVPVRIKLKQDDGFRWAKAAERLAPNDPWVKWAWAQHFAAQGNEPDQVRLLDEAVALGLPNPIELRKAYDLLLPHYALSRQRAKLDGAYAARVKLDPNDPYLRGNMARDLVVYFQDFVAAERSVREAIAMSDYPQARETLSLALYGQWAAAARDGAGPDRIQALYAKARAFDPGGHLIPTCLADWQPLQFVYARLAEKSIRREDMHRC